MARNADIAGTKQAEDLLQQVVEWLPNAIVAVDEEGRIALANSETERLFGYTRAELVGKPVEILLPGHLRAAHRAYRSGYFTKPSRRAMGPDRNFFGLCKDGKEIPLEIGLNPIATAAGNFVLASIIDVTGRKQAEVMLDQHLAAMEEAMDGMALLDKDARYVYLNPAHIRLFGYDSSAELIGNTWHRLYYESEVNFLEQVAMPQLQREGHWAGETIARRRDGSRFNQGLSLTLLDEGGLICICRDITVHKQVEQQIKTALAEKTVLLNEIHHRVKNNLQVISSLLNLQSIYTPDRQVQEVLAESQSRVRAMALIHQLLYESNNFSQVHLGQYLDRLGCLLVSSYGSEIRPNGIVLQVKAAEVYLDLQRAVPCGLVVNELVLNAFKHAFPKGQSGTIRITLWQVQGEAVLTVSDTGIGLPMELDISNSNSLGLQLVHLLTEQVGGYLRVERGQPGTRFELRFPLAKGNVA